MFHPQALRSLGFFPTFSCARAAGFLPAADFAGPAPVALPQPRTTSRGSRASGRVPGGPRAAELALSPTTGCRPILGQAPCKLRVLVAEETRWARASRRILGQPGEAATQKESSPPRALTTLHLLPLSPASFPPSYLGKSKHTELYLLAWRASPVGRNISLHLGGRKEEDGEPENECLNAFYPLSYVS